jgi:two-component system, chemotaxis family, sensor kinase CheA
VPGTDPLDLPDDFPEYAAECDEHLTAARQVLLTAEPNPGRIDRDQVDGLFRNFHSIKGLSGMVGVREAERLAHHLETYLGAIRKGQTGLATAGVEVLLDAVQALEEVIAARRDERPPPDVGPLVARLTALLPDRPESAPGSATVGPGAGPQPPAASLAPDKRRQLGEALERGRRAWRVTFTPSAELAARGVNVNAVRERLKAAGDVVHAEPAARPGGGVTFTFLVVTEAADFADALGEDGLAVEPYTPVVADAPPVAGPAAPLTPSSLVRVDLGRLDDLMRVVGELVVTRARLENGLGRVAPALPAADRRELQETSQAMERQLRDLRDGVMRARLVPVRDAFARMRLVVRDVAREAGKEVDLVLTGEQTEVDKFVVERLADPLLHLVRNAVSHGLEPPAERAAAGKRPRGRLDLRAAAAGGAIVIEVEDDGRGIDPERVFARARAVGLVPPDAPTDPAGVLDLICAPGFSTRDTADRASGRGVGMDVVRRAVEELGGTLALATRPGQGTRFTARLPLTLAIADALIVAVQDQAYAVPQAAVREVVQVEPGSTTTLENNELIRRPGGVLPLVRLADVFGAARPAGAYPALVVGEGGAAVALGADRVLGLREIVVRPLADPLVQVPGLAGATELGDGRAVLILDAVGLARYARARRRPAGTLGA